MKVKTTREFASIPVGTTGTATKEKDGTWKVKWDLPKSKPLVDWFDEIEFRDYLVVI